MSGVLLWTGVAFCGGLGAVARVLVDRAVAWRTGGTFPVGILVVNVTGSAALGALAGAGASREVLLLAGSGLLGAYTTFSTWIFDTERLLTERRLAAAAANVLLSVALGFAAAALTRSVTS